MHSIESAILYNQPLIPSCNSLLVSFIKKNKQILNIYETAYSDYNFRGRRLNGLSDILRITFFDKCGNGSDDSSLTKEDNNPGISSLPSLSGLKFTPPPINNSKTSTNYEYENPGDCNDKNCFTNSLSLGLGEYFVTTTSCRNVDSSGNNDDGSNVNSYSPIKKETIDVDSGLVSDTDNHERNLISDDW